MEPSGIKYYTGTFDPRQHFFGTPLTEVIFLWKKKIRNTTERFFHWIRENSRIAPNSVLLQLTISC
jgi:hypothetical protein